MTKLKAVPPKAAEPAKPKILIAGKPGVGKTWCSLEWPSVYYIDTEGGANLSHYTQKLEQAGGVYLGQEQGALDFDTILEQIKALASEQHSYKTLVIDSISKLFNQCVADEAEKLGDRNVFGADKKPAIAYMRRLCAWLNRLDMNVVLIAHEKPLWGVDSKGQRSEIGTTFDCWDKLEYELHLFLQIQKSGNNRTALVRKSRLQTFPDNDRFDWSYPAFAERYGKAVIEKSTTPIKLASPDQLDELQELLSIYKLEEGEKEKWFKKAGVEDFGEMSADTMQKIIDYINKKINPKGRKK